MVRFSFFMFVISKSLVIISSATGINNRMIMMLQLKGITSFNLSSFRWLVIGLLISVVSDTKCGKVGGLKGTLYRQFNEYYSRLY